MHETSLIQYTLDAVEHQAQLMQIQKVRSIRLVVGEMRGALPDLMDYAFQILTRARPLFAGARLDIEARSVLLECCKCRMQYKGGGFHAVACPACGAPEYQVIEGNELYIDSFEGE